MESIVRKRVCSLGLVWILAVCALCAADQPQPSIAGKRVLWLGDSITQAGDYVTFVLYYLDRQYPNAHFDIVAVGLSSETASCLSEKAHPFPRPCVVERLQRALDLVKPQIVIACYGMNDGIYHPFSVGRFSAFQQGILRIIRASRSAGARVILLTTPPFDPIPVKHLAGPDATDFSYREPFGRYDETLADFARWEMTLDPRKQATVIDLHGPMDAYLEARRRTEPHFSLSPADGIHPVLEGHLLMARLVLEGLHVPVPCGRLASELARIQADPLYSLVKTQRESRSAGWLDYIGYTRDRTVKTDSVGSVESQNTLLEGQIDQQRRDAKQ